MSEPKKPLTPSELKKRAGIFKQALESPSNPGLPARLLDLLPVELLQMILAKDKDATGLPENSKAVPVDEAVREMFGDLRSLSDEMDTRDSLRFPIGELNPNPKTLQQIHPNVHRYVLMLIAAAKEDAKKESQSLLTKSGNGV